MSIQLQGIASLVLGSAAIGALVSKALSHLPVSTWNASRDGGRCS